MSVAGDEPNSRAPAERHVECYLRARAIIPVGIILSTSNTPAPKPSFFLKTRFLP